jgi:hypothetical protein
VFVSEQEGSTVNMEMFVGMDAKFATEQCPECKIHKSHCADPASVDCLKRQLEKMKWRAERAERRVKIWKMAIEMAAADGCFFSQYNELTGDWDSAVVCINVNDCFAWATADAESAKFDDIPEIHKLWKESGWKGLLVWACKKRNAKPQKPMFDKLDPKYQDMVKDLPRYGGDDGWS